MVRSSVLDIQEIVKYITDKYNEIEWGYQGRNFVHATDSRGFYVQGDVEIFKKKYQEKEWNPEEVELKSEKDQIKFDDFDKVEIRVAEVKEVEKVEGSDKLLRFRLDAGDGEDRQILSGIAKFYPNEQELVGKKLQVVANLKPRKMMKKYVSQGMILSAEHDGKLTVLTVDPSVPNGSVIG